MRVATARCLPLASVPALPANGPTGGRRTRALPQATLLARVAGGETSFPRPAWRRGDEAERRAAAAFAGVATGIALCEAAGLLEVTPSLQGALLGGLELYPSVARCVLTPRGRAVLAGGAHSPVLSSPHR